MEGKLYTYYSMLMLPSRDTEIIFTCVAGGFVLKHLGRVQESVILARRLTVKAVCGIRMVTRTHMYTQVG